MIKYAVHPVLSHAQAIIANLKTKTGHDLEEWCKLVRQSACETEKEQTEWLKKQGKIGGATASIIIDFVHNRSNEFTDPDAYLEAAKNWVETMYAKKQNLR